MTGDNTLSSLGDIQPGTVISDRYEVTALLGEGGVGRVYKAVDRELEGETIALKLLRPELATNETIFKRFRNEVLVLFIELHVGT